MRGVKPQHPGSNTRLSTIHAAVWALCLGTAAPAYADLNLFAAVSTPTGPSFGWSFGRADEPVGFEVEYAGLPSSRDTRRSIGTFGASAIIQLPPMDNGARWYGTVGLGMYGLSLPNGDGSGGETRNAGLGVKLPLDGRLKIRIDYRYFRLRAGEPGMHSRHTDSHRLSAGLTVTY